MIADELRARLAEQLPLAPAQTGQTEQRPLRDYFLGVEQSARDWSARTSPDLVQSLTLPGGEPVALVLSSDWHGGARHTDYAQLRRDLALVAQTPGAYLLGVGDLIHNHKPQRKSGSALYETCMTPDEQDDWLSDVTAEVRARGKLLGVIAGNHEMMDVDEAGRHTLARWAERTQIPYLGHGGAFQVLVGKQIYAAVIRHQFPGGGSVDRSAPSRSLYQRLVRPAGLAHLDFTYLGHRHQNVFYPADYGPGECLHLCGGSYLLYNEKFDSLCGLGRTTSGNPTVLLWPETHRLEGFKGDRLSFALHCLDMVRAQEKGGTPAPPAYTPAVSKPKEVRWEWEGTELYVR